MTEQYIGKLFVWSRRNCADLLGIVTGIQNNSYCHVEWLGDNKSALMSLPYRIIDEGITLYNTSRQNNNGIFL